MTMKAVVKAADVGFRIYAILPKKNKNCMEEATYNNLQGRKENKCLM